MHVCVCVLPQSPCGAKNCAARIKEYYNLEKANMPEPLLVKVPLWDAKALPPRVVITGVLFFKQTSYRAVWGNGKIGQHKDMVVHQLMEVWRQRLGEG